MSQDLIAKLSAYIPTWRRMGRVYAGISVVLKVILIVASAVVAAKLGLKEALPDATFTVLGVIVAAGTALEAWLKPREKWKGFMTDCENAEDLLMRLQNIDPADTKQSEELRKEFQAILSTHREKNVF